MLFIDCKRSDIESIKVTYDGSVDLPTPTLVGYVFAGWYNNPEFTGTALTSIPAGWEGTLYAKWTEETPEGVIYWVLNGGTVSGTLPSFVTSTVCS